ncbi:FHA domain-containing protein [Acidihalobacter prosperus]
MAKLILSENMRVLDEFPLDRDCITIGRRGDNDIQIDDRAVSGYHCQILTVLNDSFLEDLQSTNGTYVNSKRITKHALHNGDIIILGTHQLQYENELASGEDDERYDKTMVIRPTLPQQSPQNDHPAAASEETGEAPTAPKRGHLKILNGTNKDKLFPLTRAMTTLGKPGQQVAAITRRGEKYVIIGVEADSANRYPTVNDNPVSSRSIVLNEGDVIQLNGIRMVFHIDQ